MTFSHKEIQKKFIEIYRADCLTVRAPGRINLLGEHVDYNDGFVMPASINYATIFCVAEAADGITEIYSLKYDEFFRPNLDSIAPVATPKWVNYLLGILDQLKQKGYTLKPFKCVFGGDIPMGAGLSSSASIECGFAYAMDQLNDLGISRLDIVRMAQWAEHNYAGVKCGIMDQFASVMGRADKLLVLDCQSLDHTYSPFELTDHAIVLCDTRIKHSLVDTNYNKRRAECEEGMAAVRKLYPEINSFRDVKVDHLRAVQDKLPDEVVKRCRYVVAEIQRVQDATNDLQQRDLRSFGKKMFETHNGLCHDYEVSCAELDFLVEEAARFSQVLGARMMGGGFGGCTINIVANSKVDTFVETLSKQYRAAFDIDMQPHIISIEDGVREVRN